MSKVIPNTSDCEPNGEGIIQCLRMLAEEAGTLNLARTLQAIRDAIEICETENGNVRHLTALAAHRIDLLH